MNQQAELLNALQLCPECERPVIVEFPVARCSCGWQGSVDYCLTEPRLIPCKMPYVSIDLETTGLDPETCQILEIGAVFDDWTKPLKDLPVFHRYVRHPLYTGQPYALWLNSKILKRLSGDEGIAPEKLAGEFQLWLDACGCGDSKLTASGKNFASFDLPFLKKIGFPEFAHRVLDPAVLYFRLGDTKLPDTKTCMERAGMNGTVAHTAVEDALAVVELVRQGIKRLPNF